MKTWTGVLMAGATVLMAPPAFAGDAGCLWNHTPSEAREKFLRFGGENGFASQADLQAVIPADPDATAKDCKVDPKNGMTAMTALAGYAVTEMAVRWFEVHHVATRAQLANGWEAMDSKLRAGFVQNAAAESSEPLSPEGLQNFAAHTGVADLADAAAKDAAMHRVLTGYVTGRALLAANEPKF